MPCEYYSPQTEASDLRHELSRVTALLCTTCQRIESQEEAVGHPLNPPSMIESIPGLRAWWEEHKAMDRRREAEEAARAKRIAAREADRQSALSKLSEAERKALGA